MNHWLVDPTVLLKGEADASWNLLRFLTLLRDAAGTEHLSVWLLKTSTAQQTRCIALCANAFPDIERKVAPSMIVQGADKRS